MHVLICCEEYTNLETELGRMKPEIYKFTTKMFHALLRGVSPCMELAFKQLMKIAN